jgi:hypothetical protein
MATIAPGERILLPVTTGSGPFPNERLITLESISGPVSGFIQAGQVREKNGAAFIEAEVLEVTQDALLVKLHGSFFTTTGRAYISPQSEFLRAA